MSEIKKNEGENGEMMWLMCVWWRSATFGECFVNVPAAFSWNSS